MGLTTVMQPGRCHSTESFDAARAAVNERLLLMDSSYEIAAESPACRRRQHSDKLSREQASLGQS